MSDLWLKFKAREIAREEFSLTDFKASNGWLYCFIARNKLSLRRKTNVKKTSVDDKIEAIHRFHDKFGPISVKNCCNWSSSKPNSSKVWKVLATAAVQL